MNYLSVTPIRDEAGRLSHFVGVQSDITELVNHKKAELAAKHAAVQARPTLSLSVTLKCEVLGAERIIHL